MEQSSHFENLSKNYKNDPLELQNHLTWRQSGGNLAYVQKEKP